MNEHALDQLLRDPVTGRPTFISGPRVAAGLREAGSRLNRQRAGSIAAIAQTNAPGQSLPVDVWTAALARDAEAEDVPLISLEALGIAFDDEDNLISSFLRPLTGGAEAKPFADDARGVVYKLFDLRESGGLGKKIVLQMIDQFEAEIRMIDANVFETMEKLCVLHEAGAHSTEIIGLADSGDYLIVKQPLAGPYGPSLEEDRRKAVEAMRGVSVRGGIRDGDVRAFWNAGKAWLLGDLHQGNIMRDTDDQPTVIDALIGEVPPFARHAIASLDRAITEARERREGLRTEPPDLFEGVNDDDL